MAYIYSWGPDDDGKTVDGPHFLAAVSLIIKYYSNICD